MFAVSFFSLECILKNIVSSFISLQTVYLHYVTLLILLIVIRDNEDWSTHTFREELHRLWFLPCRSHRVVLIGVNVMRTSHSIFLASELEIALPMSMMLTGILLHACVVQYPGLG